MIARPDQTEAAAYYFSYIDQVPDGDICDLLESQGRTVLDLLRSIPEDESRYRYAPGKWSISEMLNHINDAERVLTFRALWFARGFPSPLPGFDQDAGVAAARADDRPWPRLVDEFGAIRAATLALFRMLPDESWVRGGVASDKPVSVRALAYVVAGHVIHHVNVLRERYLAANGRA
jgi:hypothetical protein